MLTIFESKKTEKSHLRNLIALAKADGRISEGELELINKAASKLGLKQSEVNGLLEVVTEKDLSIPSNDSERFDQIFELVQLMMADGKIEDSEMDFCILIAEKMGFRKAIVGVLVRKVSVGLTEGLDKETIKEEAKNFLAI
jgi:uncharacterized tellurite resistance protein B-like protein